jgi:hypothetical protein
MHQKTSKDAVYQRENTPENHCNSKQLNHVAKDKHEPVLPATK